MSQPNPSVPTPPAWVATNVRQLLAGGHSLKEVLDLLDQLAPGCDAAVWWRDRFVCTRLRSGILINVSIRGKARTPPP